MKKTEIFGIGATILFALVAVMPVTISADELNIEKTSIISYREKLDLTIIKEKITNSASKNTNICNFLITFVGISVVLAAFFYILVYRAVPPDAWIH